VAVLAPRSQRRRAAIAGAVAVLATASCGGSTGQGDAVDRDRSDGGSGSLDAGPDDAAGDAGSGPVGDDSGEGCTGDGIVPDPSGFVAAGSNASGITGRWTLYTDCDDYGPLEAGSPSPGKDCSVVTSPSPESPFAPQPGTAAMCSTGSTVQVLSDDEWPLRWGAYMALDLDDSGGTAQDFDAKAAGLRGFCFYVSGNTVPAFRVRFPTDQSIADRNWYQVTLQHEGWHRVLFADLAQVVPTPTAFDPTRLLSIEIEIPASRLEAVPWDLCIDGLVALR
jgi:hypothetical protein